MRRNISALNGASFLSLSWVYSAFCAGHSFLSLNCDFFLAPLLLHHSTIKYTWEWSIIELSYLDVKIKLFEARPRTDVYCKKIDAHQYLDYASCHPRHVKKGVPYGQALRLRRICDSEEIFENRVIGLKSYLTKRGFKPGERGRLVEVVYFFGIQGVVIRTKE